MMTLPARRPAEMPRFTRAVLIFNPAARRMQAQQGRLLQRVLACLAAEGLNAQVTPTAGPGDATRLAREAVAAQSDLLIACGGDGTVNEVVGGAAGSDVPLLVIPGGTSNVLAREIGVPRDLATAAALSRKGAIRRISLGRAGDRRFVLMAGVGVDAGIVAASNSRLKRYLGEGAFWLAGFQQLARYHFLPFDVVVDGKALSEHLCPDQQSQKLRRTVSTNAASQFVFEPVCDLPFPECNALALSLLPEPSGSRKACEPSGCRHAEGENH